MNAVNIKKYKGVKTMAKIKNEKDDIWYIMTYDNEPSWFDDEDEDYDEDYDEDEDDEDEDYDDDYNEDYASEFYFKGKKAYELAKKYMTTYCKNLEITDDGKQPPECVTESILKKAENLDEVEQNIAENVEGEFGKYLTNFNMGLFEFIQENCPDVFKKYISKESREEYTKALKEYYEEKVKDYTKLMTMLND
jgi:hypothetical protein